MLRIRPTSAAGMESLASGCTGATSAEIPVLCGVSSGSRTLNSRPLSKWTASAIVRAGISCSVIAMSPKPRSRSTTQTRCFPFSDKAMPRFTARVVLPTPPLGENTVTSWPRGPDPPGATGPFSACQTCLARPTAEPRPVRSRSSTTSRMPERSASASTLVSTRRRMRITLVAGRVTRSMSARAADASRSTPGPSTMAYSSGSSASVRFSSSRLPTTWEEEPVTDVNSSALLGLFSTMMGIRDHRNRLAVVVPGPALTSDLSFR